MRIPSCRPADLVNRVNGNGTLDAQYILDHTEGVVGFYGASSMERLPVEPAITNRIREFTQLRFRG